MSIDKIAPQTNEIPSENTAEVCDSKTEKVKSLLVRISSQLEEFLNLDSTQLNLGKIDANVLAAAQGRIREYLSIGNRSEFVKYLNRNLGGWSRESAFGRQYRKASALSFGYVLMQQYVADEGKFTREYNLLKNVIGEAGQSPLLQEILELYPESEYLRMMHCEVGYDTVINIIKYIADRHKGDSNFIKATLKSYFEKRKIRGNPEIIFKENSFGLTSEEIQEFKNAHTLLWSELNRKSEEGPLRRDAQEHYPHLFDLIKKIATYPVRRALKNKNRSLYLELLPRDWLMEAGGELFLCGSLVSSLEKNRKFFTGKQQKKIDKQWRQAKQKIIAALRHEVTNFSVMHDWQVEEEGKIANVKDLNAAEGFRVHFSNHFYHFSRKNESDFDELTNTPEYQEYQRELLLIGEKIKKSLDDLIEKLRNEKEKAQLAEQEHESFLEKIEQELERIGDWYQKKSGLSLHQLHEKPVAVPASYGSIGSVRMSMSMTASLQQKLTLNLLLKERRGIEIEMGEDMREQNDRFPMIYWVVSHEIGHVVDRFHKKSSKSKEPSVVNRSEIEALLPAGAKHGQTLKYIVEELPVDGIAYGLATRYGFNEELAGKSEENFKLLAQSFLKTMEVFRKEHAEQNIGNALLAIRFLLNIDVLLSDSSQNKELEETRKSLALERKELENFSQNMNKNIGGFVLDVGVINKIKLLMHSAFISGKEYIYSLKEQKSTV